MSYENKLDEISEKLIRLQSSGGLTRPLMPVDGYAGGDFAQAKKLDEIVQLLSELKNRRDSLDILDVLGADTACKKTVAGRILDSITQKDSVDTLNALCDFYEKFKAADITAEDAERFNKLICEAISTSCPAAELVRLSDKTKLPLKKRQRIAKFAAALSEIDQSNAAKRLPELLIVKNEIEGYLNEKRNESDFENLVKNIGREDFALSFEKFCTIELSDILEPFVLSENRAEGASNTIFGLLQTVVTDLFLLKTEMYEFKQKISADLKEIAQSIKNIPVSSVRTELKAEEKSEGDKTYGSILDELSALKEDIKSALTFDKD